MKHRRQPTLADALATGVIRVCVRGIVLFAFIAAAQWSGHYVLAPEHTFQSTVVSQTP